MELKQRIRIICRKTNRGHRCIIRISCRELESWYLGQLDVVAAHFGVPELVNQQNRYRKPDAIKKPSKELDRVTKGNYQKVKGSRIMGLYLNPNDSKSTSFNWFVEALKRTTQM